LGSELAFLHLPDTRPGQEVKKMEFFRDLHPSEPGAAMIFQISRYHPALFCYDERYRHLTPLRVGTANDRRICDSRMVEQHTLNLRGSNVLATRDNHVLEPAGEKEETLVIKISSVPGQE
jgi:hypothetical protein